MSFNLWLFYYDDWELDAESVVVVPPQPPPLSPLASGGGGGHRHDRLSNDYWDVRQQFMSRPPPRAPNVPLIRPAPPQRVAFVRPAPVVPKVRQPMTQDERDGYLASMKGASSLDELRSLNRRLLRG